MADYTNYGLLIDYKYCTNCHSCEVACQQEKNLGIGEYGIRVFESPLEPKNNGVIDDAWDMTYLPMPTWRCDLCAERMGAGRKPMCVKHCLAACMQIGPLDELAKAAEGMGDKVVIFKPLGASVVPDLGTIGPDAMASDVYDAKQYKRSATYNAEAAGAVDVSALKHEYREVLSADEIGEAAFALLSIEDRLEFLNGEVAKGLTPDQVLEELGIDSKRLGSYDCVFIGTEAREVPKRNTI